MPSKFYVIGSPVTVLPFDDQIDVLIGWAIEGSSRFACVANVHMLMEAHWDPLFKEVLERADLVTPDGMPLVWMVRALAHVKQERVAGLDVLMALCSQAMAREIGVYFVGSTPEVLESIKVRLQVDFPLLCVAGMESPPFRPLHPEEDEALVARINESKAGLVFVALGCPKQERWMDAHKGKIDGVMVGLGGAFPVYAGLHRRAPNWVREAGWEWAYRLAQEPRRLWKRYLTTNLPFLVLAFKQILGNQR